jgi:tetratricopeptide (TPR) repeat protein
MSSMPTPKTQSPPAWPCLARSCVFGLLALMLLPATAQGQSRSELRNLFFDAVYVVDPEQVLYSSGYRDNKAIETPALPDIPSRLPSEILEDIRSYEESINNLIETSGIYEPVLAQEYLATGKLYEQLGDRENAVKAYEDAMHISRVNQGLFTIAQVEAVRALIEFSKNTRNFAEADKYHEYLYYLLSQNLDPGSTELVEASLDWAEWNMEAYRRLAFQDESGLSNSSEVGSIGATMLRRGELVAIEDDQFSEILFVPRTVLLGNPASIRMHSFTPDQLIDPRLKKADSIYDNMLEKDSTNLDVIREKANITFLYRKQLEQFISYSAIGSNITTTRNRSVRSVTVLRRGYADIREALLELAVMLAEDDPFSAARVYLDIGDWDLVFDRPGRAEDSYNQARELLLAQGWSETEITAFITPEPALLVPGFVTYEFTRAFLNISETTNIPYSGYMDVSFDVRPDGTLRRIAIDNSSEGTGQQIRERLLDLLRSALMRPLFVAGETVPQSDIKVRYYYAY